MEESTTIKPTEVDQSSKLGKVPEGWKLKTLDEIGIFFKGKGISKSDVLEPNIEGYAGVRYAEIYTKYHYYTDDFYSKINQESANKSNEIIAGDILFAGSGETLEDIGKSIAYLGSKKAYAGGDIIVFRQKNQDSKYLGYLLNNDFVRAQLHKLGQGHSVVHIYAKSLKKLKVIIPPIAEQQKIANILNTWDKAIVAQEKLITEKQALKKGLMQQLLTGEKRFPEFSDVWKEVRLKNILDYEQPTKYIVETKNYSDNYNTPVLTANKSFILGYTNETTGIYNNLPIILFDDFTTDNKWVDFQFKVKSSAIKILKLKNKKFDLRYIYERMQLLNFNKIDHKRYYISEYQYLKFDCPNLKEQQKISSVLIKSENEIVSFQNHLSFLKEQKQGLMQQLLTGVKRVKTT
ncbi:restriction endonuclease subunit S [Polaribacter aestuariivivens]|uniref:restriction endonuclease subunit S n=1 Tax=Polaribacter aestuariivivens TaxID=2304626 RepID=UPI003F4945D5